MLRHFIEGEGQVVLFVHGFALDARMWRPQVLALRDSYRTVAVDLPDFGPAPVAVGAQTAAGALVDVIDSVSAEPVHVVSFSLGGAVAVDLALAFPKRVGSLTLIDAPLLGRPTGIKAWSEASALAKAGDLPGAREAWLRDPLVAPARSQPGVLAAMREMAADYSGAHWCDRAETRFEVGDPAPRLGEIRVPALVLVGEHDLPGFRATAKEYEASLPRATSQVIGGVGHLASLEAPTIVNDLLIRFLRESTDRSV